MKIRSIHEKEIKKLEALLKDCKLYHLPYDKGENIHKKIQHDTDSIIVAKDKDNLVGCVFVIYDPWASFIYHLAVHPNYRKQNLGTRLMKSA
ncbi:MAG: GNAT family N-acetyltransferase, partial [Nanoarchaeota archaeon]